MNSFFYVLISALLSLAFVACDKEDAEIDDLEGKEPLFHEHEYCRYIASRDGKVRVEYPEHDITRSYCFIPAQGGEFAFCINNDAKCLACPADNDKGVEKCRLRLGAWMEWIWNCKKIPLTDSEEQCNSVHKIWSNAVSNKTTGYAPVETMFGDFISDNDGFTINISSNDSDKERCYILFLEPETTDKVTPPSVYLIQACKD